MSKQDGRGRQVTTSSVDDAAASILHLDLDAFFASVELLEHPELRGRPVIVGGRGGRSVVTAATYEARKYGVNSAMPMSIALRRCPNAIVLEPHFERYRHFSERVMSICSDVTPLLEQVSIDEAFLEVAGARKLLGTPWQIGTDLRRRVFLETGLSCSIGIAATKFVAKLASGLAKPDGLLVVPLASTLEFLHPLPSSALWGVGAKTAEQLERLGLRTIGDVANVPVATLSKAVGAAAGAKLNALAWARDARTVTAQREDKSVGHEVTFEYDVTDPVVIRRELLRMSDQVAVRLRRAGLVGKTVVLKLRYGDFTTITRSRTIEDYTDLGRRIYDEVVEIYQALTKTGGTKTGGTGGGNTAVENTTVRIRLVGVRMEQLAPAADASVALWDPDDDWRDAEHAIDAVSERFGRGLVQPAALVKSPTSVPAQRSKNQ